MGRPSLYHIVMAIIMITLPLYISAGRLLCAKPIRATAAQGRSESAARFTRRRVRDAAAPSRRQHPAGVCKERPAAFKLKPPTALAPWRRLAATKAMFSPRRRHYLGRDEGNIQFNIYSPSGQGLAAAAYSRPRASSVSAADRDRHVGGGWGQADCRDSSKPTPAGGGQLRPDPI